MSQAVTQTLFDMHEGNTIEVNILGATITKKKNGSITLNKKAVERFLKELEQS